LDFALSAALALYDPDNPENRYYTCIDVAVAAHQDLARLGESLEADRTGT
jgi:hypothetical protein